MSSSLDRIDARLRRGIARETMSESESRALWARIEAGVERSQAEPAPNGRAGSRFPVRARLIAAAAVAVALVIGVISLAPSGERHRGALDLTRLESASAAEVFGLTADAARTESLVPGPGQVLYFRLTRLEDLSGTGSGSRLGRSEIEEWIAPDGQGVRLDGSSGSSSSSGDGVEFSPLRMDFDAARSLDRSLMVTESWRATFTLAELEALPTAPSAALDYVRRHLAASTGLAERPRLDEHSILGEDFLVLATVSSMLMEAPLTGEQRAALLELIAEAPGWYRSDGSAAIEVANRGKARAESGVEGILIEASLRLNRIEAAILGSTRRKISYGVLLDPRGGAVLETRVAFGDGRPPAVRVSSDVLTLTDRSAMPED